MEVNKSVERIKAVLERDKPVGLGDGVGNVGRKFPSCNNDVMPI